jgi:hypothetical protein
MSCRSTLVIIEGAGGFENKTLVSSFLTVLSLIQDKVELQTVLNFIKLRTH